MPEVDKTAADAAKAAADAGKTGEGEGTADATKAGEKKLDLTQEQLDAIIEDRVKRAKPKDYEDLQAKAARLDAIEEEKKTEAQKAEDAKKEAEKKAAEKIALADARLRTAALINEAAKQNAVNPATVARLLADDESITVADDGTVSGVADAVKKILKDEPYLVKGTPTTSGGEFGGKNDQTLAEKISAAEAAGDYKLATQLKVQQGLSTS